MRPSLGFWFGRNKVKRGRNQTKKVTQTAESCGRRTTSIYLYRWMDDTVLGEERDWQDVRFIWYLKTKKSLEVASAGAEIYAGFALCWMVYEFISERAISTNRRVDYFGVGLLCCWRRCDFEKVTLCVEKSCGRLVGAIMWKVWSRKMGRKCRKWRENGRKNASVGHRTGCLIGNGDLENKLDTM